MLISKKIMTAAVFIVFATPLSWAVEYKGGSLRDPFELTKERGVKPAPEAPIVQSELNLKGLLIFRDSKPKALINDKIVQVGDKVGQVTILEITKDGVRVKDSAREWLLKR